MQPWSHNQINVHKGGNCSYEHIYPDIILTAEERCDDVTHVYIPHAGGGQDNKI